MADELADELSVDPLGRGYSGMSDQAAADDLNSIYPSPDTRTRNRISMTGDEIAQAADPTEYNALANGSGNSTDDQGHWLVLCARETIDPFATANVQLVIAIFGAASATVTTLQALRVESITRAQELGLPVVKVGHVTVARNP